MKSGNNNHHGQECKNNCKSHCCECTECANFCKSKCSNCAKK